MKVKEYTEDFRSNLKGSGYEYSDEFLYGYIKDLENRLAKLEKKFAKLESDHK